MKYIADMLTWSRIVASFGLMVWALVAIFSSSVTIDYTAVLAIAGIAFLTDAFDGICARRWPYTDQQRARIPWHTTLERSHAFDNAGDLLLYLAVACSLWAHDTLWLWLLIGVMVASGFIVFTIESLMKRRSPWAERVDVVYGWMFGLTLCAMLVVVAMLARPRDGIWLILGGCVVAAMVLPSKWDRLTTRPERRV